MGAPVLPLGAGRPPLGLGWAAGRPGPCPDASSCRAPRGAGRLGLPAEQRHRASLAGELGRQQPGGIGRPQVASDGKAEVRWRQQGCIGNQRNLCKGLGAQGRHPRASQAVRAVQAVLRSRAQVERDQLIGAALAFACCKFSPEPDWAWVQRAITTQSHAGAVARRLAPWGQGCRSRQEGVVQQ